MTSFTRGGYAHMRGAPMGSGGYTVWRPDHAIFDGVTLRAGDLLGDRSSWATSVTGASSS